MLGLPDYTLAALGVVIVVLVGVAVFFFRLQQAHAFRKTYGVNPESGTQGTVAGVVREVLAAMLRSSNRWKERLALYEDQAGRGSSPEEALGLNQEADELQRAIEQLNRRLSKAVKLAVRFNFADIVSVVGLEQYLSPNPARS